ncbi:MAG: DUF2225 domain-containing protein [Butyrivibrio sp.]|nr:DUF2225 domain-containing protein [Butyrivibrio sp.]
MALIDCPECGGKVSDSAEACPNCGYAVKKHFDTLKEEEKKKLEKKRIEEEREKRLKKKK